MRKEQHAVARETGLSPCFFPPRVGLTDTALRLKHPAIFQYMAELMRWDRRLNDLRTTGPGSFRSQSVEMELTFGRTTSPSDPAGFGSFVGVDRNP
jgi:hypothetical protein